MNPHPDRVPRLRAAGEEIPDAYLARVWTLCYAYIIPNGTYNFDGHIQGDNPACNALPEVHAELRLGAKFVRRSPANSVGLEDPRLP